MNKTTDRGGTMNAPKYNRCDFCGRNAHKVALRCKTTTLPIKTTVIGYCTSCFADRFTTPRYGSDRRPGIERMIDAGVTVVYDLRGKAARNKNPIPAEMNPEHGKAVEAVASFILDAASAPALDLCERCGKATVTTTQEYRNDGDRAHWPNKVTRRCDGCAQALRDYAKLPSMSLHIVKDSGIAMQVVVFATMADGITYVVGGGNWQQAQDEWTRLYDLRIAGYLPQVKFFEVRSADDTQPRFADAPALALDRLKATLTGRSFGKAENAAREAWKLTHGRETTDGKTQGVGGWFYTSAGRPIAQGLNDLARIAIHQRLIVRGADGRWYITDTEIVEPFPTAKSIEAAKVA
jgi:hypothetical protein